MTDKEQPLSVRDQMLAINRLRVHAQQMRESSANYTTAWKNTAEAERAERQASEMKDKLDAQLRQRPDQIPDPGYTFKGQSGPTYAPQRWEQMRLDAQERYGHTLPASQPNPPTAEQGTHAQQQAQKQHYDNIHQAPLPTTGDNGKPIDQRPLDNNGRPINPAPSRIDDWGRPNPPAGPTTELGKPLDTRSTGPTGRPINVPRTPTVLDQQASAQQVRLDSWQATKQRLDPLGLREPRNGGNGGPGNGGFGK